MAWLFSACYPREVFADIGVIAAGRAKGLAGQPQTAPCRYTAFERLHFLEHFRIIGGVRDHRHEPVILRCGTDEGRSADIYVFDCLFQRASRTRNRLCERVQIHYDHVDRLYSVLSHSQGVRLVVTDSEYSAVNLGVQRFDSAVEHLGKSCVIGDLRYFDSGITKRLGSASGRKQLHAQFPQSPAELGQSGLVRNAQQRAAHNKHPLLLFRSQKRDYPSLSRLLKILSNSLSAALTTSVSSGSITVGLPSRSNFEISGSAGRQAIFSFPKIRWTSAGQLAGSSRTWFITSTICETCIGRVLTSSAMRHAAESPLLLGSDTRIKRSISF